MFPLQKPRKRSLAALLVERGFFASEDEARRWVTADQVLVNGQRVDKPGTAVTSDADLRCVDSAATSGGLRSIRAKIGANVSDIRCYLATTPQVSASERFAYLRPQAYVGLSRIQTLLASSSRKGILAEHSVIWVSPEHKAVLQQHLSLEPLVGP